MTQTLDTPIVQPSRRQFIQTLGAGLLIAVSAGSLEAQEGEGVRGGRGFRPGPRRGPITIAARLHIGTDGTITVMTGKVECGQGSRAVLTAAAAEELRVSPTQIQLIMGDTGLCPDDGPTWGSQTAPVGFPLLRRGAAAGREAIAKVAAAKWNVSRDAVDLRDGKVINTKTNEELTYAKLLSSELTEAFTQHVESGVTVTPVSEWKVLGTAILRNDRQDLVTGAHTYPTDIKRPGMLYGKVLRPPSYHATLISVDGDAVKAIPGAVFVQDGPLVGVCAPTNFAATKALELLAKTAQWKEVPQVASTEIFDHLIKTARRPIPKNPNQDEMAAAAKTVKQSYRVAYVQHCPLEPRTAVAEWDDKKLTIWNGTQAPFVISNEIAATLQVDPANLRVIVPDFGGGFGGKASGDIAIEAGRLARGAGKPVMLRWSRQEEFTWAYFRPAGVFQAEASLDASNKITSWYFVAINAGGWGKPRYYDIGKYHAYAIPSAGPLREGAYRGVAATTNCFAVETFMDELANAAGADPLEFRRSHSTDDRLLAVLNAAADKFDWAGSRKNTQANVGVGISCGSEKGSYFATCAQVAADPAKNQIKVLRIVQSFECGSILNPYGLTAQNQGAVMMAMGAALREEIKFENGKILNATYADYQPPRISDMPQIDIVLVNRPDIAAAGAGETPMLGVAPAVSNAVFHATGQRLRDMPLKFQQA